MGMIGISCSRGTQGCVWRERLHKLCHVTGELTFEADRWRSTSRQAEDEVEMLAPSIEEGLGSPYREPLYLRFLRWLVK